MIFILVGQKEGDFSGIISKVYPDHMKIGPAQWLISAPGTPTSKEVWEKLAGPENLKLLGMVVPITGYYGVAPNSVWEWITAKRQVPAEP